MKIRLYDIIILSIVTIFLTFIYVGFYFPDDMIFNIFKAKLVLYSIRIFFPFFIFTFVLVYIGLRKGKIKKNNFLLMISSIIISFLIILHVWIVKFSIDGKADDQFHPFLQLMPNQIDTTSLQDEKLYRIVCIGGSTTEFKDKNGISWPEYLEKYLNKVKGLQNVKVFNCGKQWYSSLHMLINYQTNIRPYHPNAIIVMEAINDLLHNADQSYFSAGSIRADYGHFYGPVTRIARNTGFFEEYFSNRLLKLWYRGPRKVLELDSFPGLVSYKSNIETIMDLAYIDGTMVILMTQPTLIKANLSKEEKRILTMVNYESVGEKSQWSYSTALRGMEQYNDAIRTIARDRKIALIDLEKAVPKNTLYFYDDVHYQDRAYPLIVETIAKSFISKSIIKLKYEK